MKYRVKALFKISIVILAYFFIFAVNTSICDEIVGSSIYDKLNSQKFVRVIVVIDSTQTRFTDLNTKMDVLSDKKAALMSKLSSNEFILDKNWDTLSAFSGFVSLDGIVKLSEDPRVVRVDLDVGGQGGLNQSRFAINADDVNDAGFTGQGVTVAVLDTGIDTNGIDLEDDIVAQRCFCENEDGSGCCPNGNTSQSGDGSAEDGNGHGTNISGIITSDGIIAPDGIAPDAKIVAVKVLDDD
ncbi:MAG: S8 family serine peptidase, partial [Candidatus Dadabacteria bacterium]|nr:S8 family serine peptidase [Candidatus Dadabacteria bacterium]